MRAVKSGLVAGIAVGLLVASATGVPAQDDGSISSAPASTSIGFEDCDPYLRSEVCFAGVQVPLDYSDPERGTVELVVIRHAATGDRMGTLFVDPGGTGVFPASLLQRLIGIPALADHFDLVQVLPRAGALDCEPDGPMPPAWWSPEDGLADDVAAYVAYFRATADACAEEYGEDFLASLTTENAARDIEQVRKLLSVERISFLGKSHATAVGAVYASLFPDAVRSMVLDSAVVDDPALVDSEARALAREAQLQRLDRSCTAWEACPVTDGGLVAAIVEVRDRLAEQGSIGPLEMPELTTAIDALYACPWDILDVAPGLALALGGDGSSLEFGGSCAGPGEAVGMREAVICADVGPYAGTSATLLDEAQSTLALAPGSGPVLSVPCDLWPVSGSGIPTVSYAGAAPIVVVGNSYDAVTPYAWSAALAEALGPNATLLTWGGSGHAVALDGLDRCLDERLVGYMVDGVVPEPGAVCPQRGFLGIEMDDTITPNLVSGIVAGGAADAAGIQIGDIIVEADGRPVESGLDLPEGPIGQSLELKLQRGDEAVKLDVERRPPVWELWRTAD